MFVTPTNPRFIDKAWTRGGDAYILDIEDSIPLAEKARCRGLIRESIAKANKGGATIYVRINKPFVDADLPCSVWPGVDRIMLPKVDTAAEMQYAHALITQLEKNHGSCQCIVFSGGTCSLWRQSPRIGWPAQARCRALHRHRCEGVHRVRLESW
jgi:citrate lyase beta subunit